MTTETMAEEKRKELERAKPVDLAFFLAISALVAVLAASAAYGLAVALGKPIAAAVVLLGLVGGFVVSTGGWLVVLRGFRDDPTRIVAYFGAGLLTKMVLLGMVLIVVGLVDSTPLAVFFIPFAAVFFATGFAQLGITVKGATKLLDQARLRAPMRNPAAPGAAVDPEERG